MSTNRNSNNMMRDPMMMGMDLGPGGPCGGGPGGSKQGSTIPHFSKAGTALTQAERRKIADKRGVCLTCEAKTHNVGVFGRKPLTNDDVYQGSCIRCNGNAVPPNILADWQSRNQQQAPTAAVTAAASPRPHLSGISRFRAAGQAVGMVATTGNSGPSLIGPGPSHVGTSIQVNDIGTGGSGRSQHTDSDRDESPFASLNSSSSNNQRISTLMPSSSAAAGQPLDQVSISIRSTDSSSSGSYQHRISSLQPTRVTTNDNLDPRRINSSSYHDERSRQQSYPNRVAHSPNSPLRSDFRYMRSGSDTLPTRQTPDTFRRLTTIQHSHSMSVTSSASPDFLGNAGSSHDAMNRYGNESLSSVQFDNTLATMSMSPRRSQAAPISEDHVSTHSTSTISSNKSKLVAPSWHKTSESDRGKDHATLLKDIQDNRSNPEELVKKLHAYRNLLSPSLDEGTNENRSVDDLVDHEHIIEVMIQTREILYSTTTGLQTSASDQNEALFLAATSVLWCLCVQDEGRKYQAVEIGCLDPLVNILTNQPENADYHPELVASSIGTLSVFAEEHDMRLLISQRGGIERIVQNLVKYESDPGVFEWACRALIAIVSTDDDDFDEHRTAAEHNIAIIVESGGVPAIASSMTRHAVHPVAEWHAFRLLACLIDQRNDKSVDKIISQMVESNMHNVCMEILKARPTTTDLILVTCEFMRILLEADRSQISGVDCASAVLRALDEKSASVDLRASATHLLATVAQADNEAKKLISENSTFRGLVTGLSSKLDHLYLVRSTMLLLCVLSCDESSFDYSLLEPIKNVTESIYRKYPDNSDLNTLICNFVANNATVLQGQPDCVATGVVSEICKIAGANGNSEVRRAFIVIASQVPESSGLHDAEGLKRLLESLRGSTADLQLSICEILSGIFAKSESACDTVLTFGGLAEFTSTLMSTESETVGRKLLELMSTLVEKTPKKAVQLPTNIVTSILQVIQKFSNLTQIGCTTIRNVMLKTPPGFNVYLDGFAQAISRILDDISSHDSVIIDACGALWACCAKNQMKGVDLSRLFASCLGVCARNRGAGEASSFNSAVLTEVTGALSALLHCVRESPINIPDGDIDLIISILDVGIECDLENITLMTHMLDIIMTLCFVAKEILIQYGAIVVVIDSMVEHEQNEDIQQRGCGILALLASTENLQVNISIAETDGIDMLVNALASFPENVRIQTDACRALSHLSIDHESRLLISSQGGLLLIVNAMTKYPDEANLLEAACGALLNLSSDAGEQVLASSNVIETVIKTMRHCAHSTKIQEKCLGILQNFSMRSKLSKKNVADAGGIDAIVFSIKEFMGSPSVIERAFTTLWSLAVLEENQVRIAEEQGIGVVVNTMMANIMFAKVQKQGCGCLCTLSSNSQNKTRIRELGGVDAIVFAMWAHYDSDDVLMEACRALSSIAVNVQTNEVMVASGGEINAIMSSMRRFPNSERLQEHACVALRNFFLSSDNISLIRHQQSELEDLIRAASARFPDKCSARVQQVLDSFKSTIVK